MSENGEGTTGISSSSNIPTSISRRMFVEAATLAGTGLTTLAISARALGGLAEESSAKSAMNHEPTGVNAMHGENSMADEITKEKIRRALWAGPDSVTREATVAEMDAQGKMTVLRPGRNQWVCVPGNQNIIGEADMCCDPMGIAMDDGLPREEAETNECHAGTDLHAQRRHPAKLHSSV